MTTQPTNGEASASKAPSHYVYHVRDRENKKGIFTRVGAAWPHGDGKGFNLQIDCVPLDGRLTLRIPSEDKQ